MKSNFILTKSKKNFLKRYFILFKRRFGTLKQRLIAIKKPFYSELKEKNNQRTLFFLSINPQKLLV